MDTITEYANAKINLTLEIINKRADGYHNLRSLFVPLDFHDFITMSISSGSRKITLESDIQGLNTPKNLMYKAAELFLNTNNLNYDVTIKFVKRIPSQAGLGGGSSDAAAVIRGLKKYFYPKAADDRFIKLCEKIGADVPFCYFNKPAIVTGIGEKIEFVEIKIKYYVLLVKPKKGLSTKKIFSKLESTEQVSTINYTKNIIHAFSQNSIEGITNNLHNDLEHVAQEFSPEIKQIKDVFLANNIKANLMTGSGSTVFALIKNKQIAKKLESEFRNQKNFALITKIYTKENLT